MKVLLAYNLRRDESLAEEAEFDSAETICGIADAISSLGHDVMLVEEDEHFYDAVKPLKDKVDLVFNIAEGRHGALREALVPFMLESLGMPYTASGPKAMILALDKHMCSALLRSKGIPCPDSVLLNTGSIPHAEHLSFPVIMKPNCEGSSKDISDTSVFKSFGQLKKYLYTNNVPDDHYIAEEYIPGREFTVAAFVSKNGVTAYRPMEVIFKNSSRFNVYSYEIKKSGDRHVIFDYSPDISSAAEEKMKDTAEKVISILGIRDLARLDFRLAKDGVPYFIEVNPLPGLAKNYSDFPNICRENGMDYENVISMIIRNAKERMRQ